ncbi:hypothetical protein GCM10020218_059620 [Dactylosporangium vinaceum]
MLTLCVGGASGPVGWHWMGHYAAHVMIQSAQHRLSQELDARWATGAQRPRGGRPLAPAGSASDLVVLDHGDQRAARCASRAPRRSTAGNTGIAVGAPAGAVLALDRSASATRGSLETRDTWFVYRVIEATVVRRPTIGAVLDPPPPAPVRADGARDGEPRLSTARRLVRQATLVRRDPRQARADRARVTVVYTVRG